MFKTALIAYQGFNKLRQFAVLVMLAITVFAVVMVVFESWLYFHDRGVKKEFINDVNIKTNNDETLQVENDNQVKSAHDRLSDDAITKRLLSACRDCDQQEVGEAGVQHNSNFKGRQANNGDGAANRPSQYDLSKPQSCYPERVSDEFGLPVWVLDADGLLVQKTVEVCR